MGAADIYSRQGFGKGSGFGSRPALLVVDFINGFADPDRFGGGSIRAAIGNTKRLLDVSRSAGLPIVFTRIVYADDGSDAGVFCRKVPGLKDFIESAPDSQVVPELTPMEGEYVLPKTQPSAFFGTDLAERLAAKQVDTVLVAGCTTSGCVRASVVDSMSHNFLTVVVTDCVGDRAEAPHRANLFDMEQKYADLATLDEVVVHLGSVA